MSTFEPDWDRISLSNYAADLLNSRKWFETANELTAAMSVLEPHVLAWWQSLKEWSNGNAQIFREHGFQPLYMMLASYAIENLCKGYSVRRLDPTERDIVRQHGRLPKRLETHRLAGLITDTEMSIDNLEEELLARLERAAIWFGRYPIPRFFRERNTAILPDGHLQSVSWQGSADVYRTKAIIKRIRKHVGARDTYRLLQE
jgi:hypothetical protein